MTIAFMNDLHQQVAAVAPVQMITLTDDHTVSITFDATATQEQIDAANAIAASFDPARWTLYRKIEAEWERRKVGGFSYMGKVIDSDTTSRENVASAAMSALSATMAGVPWSLDPAQGWKCQDNSYLPLTAAEMIQMQATMVQAGVALFAYAQSLKGQVKAAEDPTTIDLTSGWPEV